MPTFDDSVLVVQNESVALSASGNFERPPIGAGLRGRNLRTRRWHAAMGAVRFAVRILSLTRARLSVAEERAALAVYIDLTCRLGALEARPAIRSALFAVGQLVDDDEIDLLCERAGYTIGDGALQFEHFARMLTYRKRKFQRDQDTTDTTAAFESLMDPASHDIDATHLLRLCREFDLSEDVDALIRETDADGSGKIDYEEFAALLDAAQEGDEAAEAERALGAGATFLATSVEIGLAPSKVPRATLHRRALRAATRHLYVALRRRILHHFSHHAGSGAGPPRGLSLAHSLRGGNHALSLAMASGPAPDVKPTAASSGAPEDVGDDDDDSELMSPGAAAAADADALERQRRLAAIEARRAARFDTSPYVPEPPPPFPVPAATYRKSAREMAASVGDRLSPRRPESAAKAETARAHPFGSSAARFAGQPVLDPLPVPSMSAPVRRREHPADVTTIYRRASARTSRRVSPIESPRTTPARGRSPVDPVFQPPSTSAPVGGTPSAGSPAPMRPAPAPEYATFNPFLGLPPAPPPPKSSRSAARTLYRNGSASRRGAGSRPGSSKPRQASSDRSQPPRQQDSAPPAAEGAPSPRKPPRPTGSAPRRGSSGARRDTVAASDVPPELARTASTHSASNYQLLAKHVAQQQQRPSSTASSARRRDSRPASAATTSSASAC